MKDKQKPGRPPTQRLNKKSVPVFLYPDEIAAIDKLCEKNGERSPWIRDAVTEKLEKINRARKPDKP